MPLLTKEIFRRLANFDNNPCISIYMPTNRSGKEVIEEKDRIQLKSQWKKVFEKLKENGLPQKKIDELGKPVETLLENHDFWRHQSDGLAIFIGSHFFEKFTVPVNFETYAHVSDHFYLKPLIPLFTGDSRFYILSLQMDLVKMYEATQYTIQEIVVDDLVPSQIEERVGFDYEEKTRLRQKVEPQQKTVFQGDDAAERDRKNEILRFFNSIDKGLQPILNEKKTPLIVACQDYLFPIYQEANSYQHLYSEPIPGNPADHKTIFELHAAALDKLEPYFNQAKQAAMHRYNELPPERKSTDILEIIPSIFEGKVETLFLQNREDVWGNYNENMASVQIDDTERSGNISLMNLATIKTIAQNGTVYLVEKQFMPDKNAKMNAMFRY